eukprot:CAMPEP_0172512198 /NCGR_PEP_ID=MMETSP1066-20121228/242402_1 /TAXON_ID=671091 /ORGANISM="Coscinodiscus wailesii, Strain CCMP2513" /LENGTH=331 /DNA_ID=CAMNT_0013291893 /DNA_START=26 /DNA_END=1021 /DNA_ORIENTATION=-
MTEKMTNGTKAPAQAAIPPESKPDTEISPDEKDTANHPITPSPPQDEPPSTPTTTDDDENSNSTSTTTPTSADDERLARKAAQEAKAVAEATATADAAYVPSPALLSASSPLPLLRQVDGPDLRSYNGSPSVYTAKSIPIAVRGRLDVPIYVTSGGSVVEYSVSAEWYDIAFGITAERDDKETIVKEMERVDAHLAAITGKFLVGSVPCVLIFSFDNEYSWLREKLITYKIVVTPPSKENVSAGRRRRANSALKIVSEDKASAVTRLDKATKQKTDLREEVDKLEKELIERKKSLEVAEKEEEWLRLRVELRQEQTDMLKKRLEQGWEDED